MSNASVQATAFYSEVALTRLVWTVRDDAGHPAPLNSRGVRTQPFWSSLSRVERIIKGVPAYGGFRPVEMSWEEFRDTWLPKLATKGMEVGVNWSGRNARGLDLAPEAVREAVEWQIEHAPPAV
jgi:Protein of unknown function (DUF2750)